MINHPRTHTALILFFLAPAFCLCFVGDCRAEETINPHWTGKHCKECHLNDKGKVLKFDGDVERVCNRCHDGKSAAEEKHPVGMQPSTTKLQGITRGWPLRDEKLSCITCHQVTLQMFEKIPEKFNNPNFVRGGPYRDRSAICFTCHDDAVYRAKNPHRQLDAAGAFISSSCLVCHRSMPENTFSDSREEIDFVTAETDLCLSCHPSMQHSHPVRGNHLVSMSDDALGAIKELRHKRGVELPLQDKTITCSTCHNSHQQGVISRAVVQHGAGEDNFLRLDGGRQLCVACHDTKSNDDIKTKPATKMLPSKEVYFHTPFKEQKCKACHAATRDSITMPQPVSVCFSSTCHDLKIISGAKVHEPSVLTQCSLCHQSHTAAFDKLLKSDEIEQCSVCHLLTRNKKGEIKKTDHVKFERLIAALEISRSNECSVCHIPAHKNMMDSLDQKICSGCHVSVRRLGSENIHNTYAEKRCCACHNPHSSPHEFLLKEPIESYR